AMLHEEIVLAGKKIEDAEKALIMLHGRGANAKDILSLSNNLQVKDFAILAPQAKNNSWYPQSFLAPPQQNEPWLSSALALIENLLITLNEKNISKENIYFVGFSQGACLTLEFVTRNAARYGGVVAFTGGLIGDKIYKENYEGNFEQTPVFIGSSNPDLHIPVERVYATTNILKNMGAEVTEKIYDNMGHTIIQDEINQANSIIFNH
ncbi:MAG: dienelactone hydrolase family protein, partial [Chitinophagaceae bacterium]